jgi:transcriptional antiterminator NusG
LRHLIPDLNQPEAAAELVRNLELLKRLASTQLEATTQAQSGQAAWYLLYCTSGNERKLKQRLLHRLQQFGLGHKVLQVVVPGETETESDEAKVVQATPPSFYGIVLVEMASDEELWEIIRTAPGVTAYLGSDDRPTPLQPDQLDSLLRGTADIFRLSSPEELPDQEKIRLCIRLDSLPLRQELYKIIGAETDLELIDEPTEANIILTETGMPRGVLSSNSFIKPADAGPSEVSPELWFQADQRLILVQDLANYMAFPAGLRDYLTIPFSKEELLRAVYRISRLSQTQDTLSSALQFLKTLRLGHWVEMSLSVTDLAASLFFYEKLGLKPVDGGEKPYPWAVVSDETLYLGLHQQPFPSPRLSYFSWGETISKRVAILKKLDITFDRITTRDIAYGFPVYDLVATAEFTSLEGQPLCLANFQRDMRQPQRSLLITNDKFGEFSLKTADVNQSVAYWEQLGFKRVGGSDKPYPWATLSDGLIRLGLHQTTRFTRPTISYFSPDIPDRLRRLREQDIPFRSEYKDAQGCTIGAVIHSPDSQPFFLFAGQLIK